MSTIDHIETETLSEDVTPETIHELVNAIVNARQVAEEISSDVDDLQGSCNFDSPVLAVTSKSRRWAEAAIRMAGGTSFPWKLCGRFQGLVIGFPSGGQGARRTRFAEVLSKELQLRGWASSMYYQVD